MFCLWYCFDVGYFFCSWNAHEQFHYRDGCEKTMQGPHISQVQGLRDRLQTLNDRIEAVSEAAKYEVAEDENIDDIFGKHTSGSGNTQTGDVGAGEDTVSGDGSDLDDLDDTTITGSGSDMIDCDDN